MSKKKTVIRSLTDLQEILEAYSTNIESIWFRGQSSFKWGLEPSLARPPFSIDHEKLLAKRFKQNAYQLLSNPPTSEWDWAFLMQHYGIPTRLLDWTESPLVALYFAIESKDHGSEDGAFWMLYPKRLNEFSGINYKIASDIPCFGEDKFLEEYLPSKIGLGNKVSQPVAAIAPRKFIRINAQYGTFVIYETNFTGIDRINSGKCAVRFKIPAAAKPKLLKQLRAFQIHRNAIYPELANLSEEIKKEFA